MFLLTCKTYQLLSTHCKNIRKIRILLFVLSKHQICKSTICTLINLLLSLHWQIKKTFLGNHFLNINYPMKKKEETSRELLAKTPRGAMWVAMFDICLLVNFSEIARSYFNKNVNWFNQRLHGYNVNGKPAEFKPDELKILSASLRDISRKILEAADKIDAIIK